MTTQTDIIKMLKQGDSFRRIQRTLLVSPNTISKANKALKIQLKRDQDTALAMKKIDEKRKSDRIALSSVLSKSGTKKPAQHSVKKRRIAQNSTVIIINKNKLKTWMNQLDRSKYHGTSLAAIKRQQDHKRPGLLDGHVDLINEYLEGV